MEQTKISELVEENMKTIFAYALSRTSVREDAEDLAGDIILAILQNGSRLRDDDAFFGYIWAIAANTYKKFLRRQSRVHFEELAEEFPADNDFTQDLVNAAEYNTLRRELALLSGEYRECTVTYYFEGLSCAETAAKLHISLEMVKYYLFKTRKILKEGIYMEREFGQKSYQPAVFTFQPIFSGRHNAEYQNLFNRKLPGNILVSAYYTPMTIRELAIELGVASAYLEDEIALLEKYNLITGLPGGKYQARLVIFTEDYLNEFYRAVEEKCRSDMRTILSNMKGKLPELRGLGCPGVETHSSEPGDTRLIWSLLFEVIRNGWYSFKEAHGESFKEEKLYGNAEGTCYGQSFDRLPADNVYGCDSFAGYYGLTDRYAVCYADARILPEQNRFQTNCDLMKENLETVLAGHAEPIVPIFNVRQKKEMEQILRQEITDLGSLYESLYRSASSILRTHAPQNIADIADKTAANTLLFHTVGLLFACAVKSGALAVPAADGPLAAFIYETA